MPFDSFALAAVTDELTGIIAGRVQRIIQPSGGSLALEVYSSGRRQWLVLSANARYARVHFASEKLAKGFPVPSPFVMLARKYLDGAHFIGVEQTPYERIVRLEFRGREGPVTFIAECMGKHSNLILVDASARILGALKIVGPQQSRVRPVLVGRAYSPPPARGRDEAILDAGPRLDPAREPAAFERALRSAVPGTSVTRALMGLLAGCGPFLAEQIRLMPGAPQDVHEASTRAITAAAVEMYGLLNTREWHPTVFAGAHGHADYCPYVPLGVAGARDAASISVAIEECMSAEESRDALGAARNTLLTDIEHRLRSSRRKLDSLARALEATSEADSVLERGQLLLAYAHAAEPGSEGVWIDDLDITIPLDPTLTARENAERLFNRYRKLRDAARKIPSLIEAAGAEVSALEDLRVFATLADSEAALRGLRHELSGEASATHPGKAQQRQGPPRFRADGYTAIVGRNARENEEITFRIARRDDLWLHARERTGAHVVLRAAESPSPDVVERAAALAAYYSEARNDTRVDVDVARVRDVRRIPGGPPGKVTYRSFDTVRVAPSVDGWSRA